MARTVAFPGSFDPLTVAHIGIADAARSRLDADRIDLIISHRPLAKDAGGQAPVADRLGAIARAGAGRPWLRGRTTGSRLLADIAEGYDYLVIGADKWHQLHDPCFYDDATAMTVALSRLPTLVVVPRPGSDLPSGSNVVVLALDPALGPVSSTAVRAGRTEWMA